MAVPIPRLPSLIPALPMTLVRAAQLGIDRFANDANHEHWSQASSDDKKAIIRAVYQQVLGQQHLMESERLSGAESLFCNGDLTVRELVRTVAKSALYRSRFFENCNAYRFIELNHKHLLGRAPQNRDEMLHHFTILQEQGYDAEIDSYVDSAEYQQRFGQNTVPHLHGWGYSAGHEGRQFSWLMQLARGASASVKGDRSGIQAALNRPLHQNRAVPVAGAAPAVIISNIPLRTDYSRISTDGPFRASVSAEPGLWQGEAPGRSPRSHAQDQRRGALGVAAGGRATQGSSGRLVTITATALVRNAYSRSGSTTVRVPLERMNEALQRLTRLGARVTQVAVSGEDTILAGATPHGSEQHGRDHQGDQHHGEG